MIDLEEALRHVLGESGRLQRQHDHVVRVRLAMPVGVPSLLNALGVIRLVLRAA